MNPDLNSDTDQNLESYESRRSSNESSRINILRGNASGSSLSINQDESQIHSPSNQRIENNSSFHTSRSIQSFLQATSSSRSISCSNSPTEMHSSIQTYISDDKSSFFKSNNSFELENKYLVKTYFKKFEPKNIILESLLIEFEKLKINSDFSHSTNFTIDKKMSMLINMFSKSECYLPTIYSPIYDNYIYTTNKFSTKKQNATISFNQLNSETGNQNASKSNSSEFYVCSLCSHCLFEPITLVCGCTFCKSCFIEYNSYKKKNKIKQEIKNTEINYLHDEDEHTTIDDQLIIECYNCNKTHTENSIDQFKVNTFVSVIVEKLWSKNLEIRKLRNDIRKYVLFDIFNSSKFDHKKYVFLFESAYEKDPSNHLILADLFLINYFCDNFDICLKFAQQIIALKPYWAYGYFLRALYYFQMENLSELKISLQNCLNIDSSFREINSWLSDLNNIECQPKNTKFYKKKLYSYASFKKKKNRLKQKIQIDKLEKPSKLETPISVTKRQTLKKQSTLNSSLQKKRSKLHTKYKLSFDERKSLKPQSTESSNNLDVSLNVQNSLDNSIVMSIVDDDINKYLFIDTQLIRPNDLECSLCYRLIYNPVTTPCGHAYCCSCLDRSLDHQDKCPLCKSSLAQYLAERRQSITTIVDKLIKTYFPVEFEERKKQYNEELKELTKDENEIPIFVCTLALPFAPCPLHIYEPRYRLMLRRAIEIGSKQFGMCMYSERTPYNFTEYGTILEIQNYQFTRDGRAIVATIGGRRFRVLDVKTKDGYNVAKIEWIDDKKIENEQEKIELQILHNEVYRMSEDWYKCIPVLQKQRILKIYGINSMPEAENDIQSNGNGPLWHWFLINILPLDYDFQYRFLSKTNLVERLKQIKRIILVLMTRIERPSLTTSSESAIPQLSNSNETSENDPFSTSHSLNNLNRRGLN